MIFRLKESTCDLNSSHAIASNCALAIAWQLGVMIEKGRETFVHCKLSEYNLYESRSVTAFNKSKSGACIIDNQEIDHFFTMRKLLDKCKNPQVKKELFKVTGVSDPIERSSGISQRQHSHFYLSKDSGDYRLAEAFGKQITDWTVADRLYWKQMGSLKGKSLPFDLEQWRVIWNYINGNLPEHLLKIRDIAWLSQITQPDVRGIYLSSSTLKINGPRLEIVPEKIHEKPIPLRLIFNLEKKNDFGSFSDAFLVSRIENVSQDVTLPLFYGNRSTNEFF